MEYWEQTGRRQNASTEHAARVTLDDAVTKFEAYLEGAVDLREATRGNLKYRAKMFANEVRNLLLADVPPERIEAWLDGRRSPAAPGAKGGLGKPMPVSPVTKENDRRALARFFRWCSERPQRFIVSNLVPGIRVAKPEHGELQIYPPPRRYADSRRGPRRTPGAPSAVGPAAQIHTLHPDFLYSPMDQLSGGRSFLNFN